MSKIDYKELIYKQAKVSPKLLAAGIAGALIAPPVIHRGLVSLEKDQELHGNIGDYKTKKEKMQVVRTAFKEEAERQLGDDISVKASRTFPLFGNDYSVELQKKDNGDKVYAAGGVDFFVRGKEKSGHLGYIKVNEKFQGKGYGRKGFFTGENAMKNIGLNGMDLYPAWDGPSVWSKKEFGMKIPKEDKAAVLGEWKKYADKKGLEAKDMGDNVSDYPSDFWNHVSQNTSTDLLWEKNFEKSASYKELIYKQAALKQETKLRPHQEAAIARHPGQSVVFAHGVGSGKTLTGIAKFEKLKEEGKANKALVVVPAGLRDNFKTQGFDKFTDDKGNIVGNSQERSKKIYGGIDPNADYNVISYDMFRVNPEKYIRESGADTVITDESHKSKNEGTMTTDSFKSTRHLYKNYIGLTGSVISNSPADIQPLVDIATGGKHNVGKNKNEFLQMYAQRSKDRQYKGLHESRVPIVGIKNKKELARELSPIVDYLGYQDIKDAADMPGKNVKVVKVPVSKQQARLYRGILKNDPQAMKIIKRKRLETLKDDEAAAAFNRIIEARKLMNSVGSVQPGISLSDSAKLTPKTKRLLDDLDEHLKNTKDGQAILLSNLVNGGTDVLEQGLKDRGIEYGTFKGKGNKDTTEQSRQQNVVDYNKRKKRVMVVSPAGGEGLSLGDTTWEGVLDPHYNPERMLQMEARGIRSGGLKNRPQADRNVQVNRYLATMPKTFGLFKSSIRTPDEMIYEISSKKDAQNQMFYNFLRENQKNKTASEMLLEWKMEKVASQESPSGTRNLQHVSKIQTAAQARQLIEIKYKDKKGVVSLRKVEPYKLSDGDFWAFDPEKDSIRRFKIKGLRSVKPTKEIYKERWPIEMNWSTPLKKDEPKKEGIVFNGNTRPIAI